MDCERKLVDLRAFYKISSKYDYFLVFLLFSSFCSHGYLQKKKRNLTSSILTETTSKAIWLLWSEFFNNSIGILGADGFDYWLLSNLILFWLFNFPPFFVCIFSSFFFIFPFFISYCTVQCVTFLIFLVGAWLCTSKGKIQWCIKLLSAHHQGPTSSVNKACYKSYEMLILLLNSFCQSLFRKSVATNFTLEWFLSFMNSCNMPI